MLRVFPLIFNWKSCIVDLFRKKIKFRTCKQIMRNINNFKWKESKIKVDIMFLRQGESNIVSFQRDQRLPSKIWNINEWVLWEWFSQKNVIPWNIRRFFGGIASFFSFFFSYYALILHRQPKSKTCCATKIHNPISRCLLSVLLMVHFIKFTVSFY